MKRIVACCLAALCTLFSVSNHIGFAAASSAERITAAAKQKAGENAFWTIEDGVLTISGEGTTYIYGMFNGEPEERPWSEQREEITAAVVEEGITSVGQNLFRSLPNLKSVVLPDSVVFIGDCCFCDCPSLTELRLPKGVCYFGENLFDGDPALFPDTDFQILNGEYLYAYSGENQSTVTVPDGIKTIHQNCFYEHTEIIRIILPQGVETINNSAFQNCTALETVVLPDSVKQIGNSCFSGCPSLTTLRIPKDTVLGINVFDGDTALFPDTDFQILNGEYLYAYTGETQSTVTVPDGISIIGRNCFKQHTEIKKIVLPQGVETILGGAFQSCTALESVLLPDSLQEISEMAFGGCLALKTVSIPDSVKRIGYNAFSRCTALSAIRLPASLSVLEQFMFFGCTSLTDVEFAGNRLESVQNSSFENCSLLENIHFPEQVQYIAPTAFDGCDKLKETHTKNGSFVIDRVLVHAEPQYPVYQIPNGVVTVANNALNASKAVAIECPDSLRYICDNAFSSNSILYEVLLNEGCETIGKNAFSECDSLNSLSVPATVKQIGAQEKCSLTDLYGSAGSAAEEFANENRITFHDGPEYHGPDLTLDYSKDGWYFGNSKAIFGDDYYLTDADSQYLNRIGFDSTKMDRSWSGSCVGLAITVILAKNGAFSPAQLQAGANTLSAVEPTDTVRSFINYYHCIQDRGVPSPGYIPDALIFYRMLKIAKNIPNGESPFLLTFATKTGSHGVVGYGQETGEWEIDGKTYDGRILVWDSNFPNALHDESCLYYNNTTFDYCIPHYGVHVTEGADDNTAGIITVCNDLAVLNAYPYPFETVYLKGDVDCNGAVQIADAVLLARYLAEDQVTVTAQGLQNAELDGNADSLDAGDFIRLLQMIAGVK